MLTCQCSAYSKESTRLPCTVLGIIDIRDKLDITYSEQSRIIQQSTIDASSVRTLYMTILIPPVLKRFLLKQGIKHLMVLHFTHAYKSTTYAFRQYVRTHIGKSLCHITQFVRILHTIPVICACRQKIIIKFSLVMTSVEEVLLIIETDSI